MSRHTGDELRQQRLDKAHQWRQAGINPYPYRYQRTHSTIELQKQYENLEAGAEVAEKVRVAGRVMARRVFGKLAFFSIQDEQGSIQFYLEKQRIQDHMGEGAFERLKNGTDAGDILGAEGTIKRTEKGELSVYVTTYELLTKFYCKGSVQKFRQLGHDRLTRHQHTVMPSAGAGEGLRLGKQGLQGGLLGGVKGVVVVGIENQHGAGWVVEAGGLETVILEKIRHYPAVQANKFDFTGAPGEGFLEVGSPKGFMGYAAQMFGDNALVGEAGDLLMGHPLQLPLGLAGFADPVALRHAHPCVGQHHLVHQHRIFA